MPTKQTPQLVDAPAETKRGKPITMLRQSDLGAERCCSRCREWWPADRDFFYTSSGTSDGLHEWCKACYREWRATTTGNSRRHSATVVVTATPVPALASVAWLGTQPFTSLIERTSP